MKIRTLKNKLMQVIYNIYPITFTLITFIFVLFNNYPPIYNLLVILLAVIADKVTLLYRATTSKKLINITTNIENMNTAKPQEFWDELEKKINNKIQL